MTHQVTQTNLADFADMLQTWLQTNFAAAKNVGPAPTIEVQTGSRYARLVIRHHPGSGSAYGFVDLTNGDLLKAAGWKAPAKGKRGNIFAAMPLNGCTPYGMAYFR